MAIRNSLIGSKDATKIYKDFDLSFARNLNTNDVARKVDVQAVKQSLRNLLRTSYYEKPFNPTYGSPIPTLLFEPCDTTTANLLANEIRVCIENFEPRVRVEEVIVRAQPDQNSFSAKVTFHVIGIESFQELDIVLERLR